jgi:hypothetical protein
MNSDVSARSCHPSHFPYGPLLVQDAGRAFRDYSIKLAISKRQIMSVSLPKLNLQMATSGLLLCPINHEVRTIDADNLAMELLGKKAGGFAVTRGNIEHPMSLAHLAKLGEFSRNLQPTGVQGLDWEDATFDDSLQRWAVLVFHGFPRS